MSKKKPKFYVVWSGHEPGVYKTWKECKKQVDGYTGARYKLKIAPYGTIPSI